MLRAPSSSAVRRACASRSTPAWSNRSMVPSSCSARRRQSGRRGVSAHARASRTVPGRGPGCATRWLRPSRARAWQRTSAVAASAFTTRVARCLAVSRPPRDGRLGGEHPVSLGQHRAAFLGEQVLGAGEVASGVGPAGGLDRGVGQPQVRRRPHGWRHAQRGEASRSSAPTPCIRSARPASARAATRSSRTVPRSGPSGARSRALSRVSTAVARAPAPSESRPDSQEQLDGQAQVPGLLRELCGHAAPRPGRPGYAA